MQWTSSYGPCVDLYAPGTLITSLSHDWETGSYRFETFDKVLFLIMFLASSGFLLLFVLSRWVPFLGVAIETFWTVMFSLFWKLFRTGIDWFSHDWDRLVPNAFDLAKPATFDITKHFVHDCVLCIIKFYRSIGTSMRLRTFPFPMLTTYKFSLCGWMHTGAKHAHKCW